MKSMKNLKSHFVVFCAAMLSLTTSFAVNFNQTMDELSDQCRARINQNLFSGLRLEESVNVRRERFIDQIKARRQALAVQGTTRPTSSNLFRATSFPERAHEVGFLFLHGLWETSNQFSRFFEIPRRLNANFISITYRGNGERASESANTTAQDWKMEVREAIQLLSEKGSSKVILIGHSTGGALAAEVAADPAYANQISGLVLIEPALRTDPLVRAGACLLGRHTVGDFSSITRYASGTIPQHTQNARIGLGCEVDKILDSVTNNNPFRSRRVLYEAILAPSIVFSAIQDIVVLNSEIDIFHAVRGSRSSHFSFPGTRHGGTEIHLRIDDLVSLMNEKFRLQIPASFAREEDYNRVNYLAMEDYEVNQQVISLLSQMEQAMQPMNPREKLKNYLKLIEVKKIADKIKTLQTCVPAFQDLPQLDRTLNSLARVPALLQEENILTREFNQYPQILLILYGATENNMPRARSAEVSTFLHSIRGQLQQRNRVGSINRVLSRTIENMEAATNYSDLIQRINDPSIWQDVETDIYQDISGETPRQVMARLNRYFSHIEQDIRRLFSVGETNLPIFESHRPALSSEINQRKRALTNAAEIKINRLVPVIRNN